MLFYPDIMGADSVMVSDEVGGVYLPFGSREKLLSIGNIMDAECEWAVIVNAVVGISFYEAFESHLKKTPTG